MQHVELSVTGPHLVRAYRPGSTLDRWAAAVTGADEPSLVINANECIVAASPAFCQLLGLTESVVGRGLLDGVLHLLDFADGGVLIDVEVGKIPPLLALTSGRLARGLLKVSSAQGDQILDAVATPLMEDGATMGSLTFFSRV